MAKSTSSMTRPTLSICFNENNHPGDCLRLLAGPWRLASGAREIAAHGPLRIDCSTRPCASLLTPRFILSSLTRSAIVPAAGSKSILVIGEHDCLGKLARSLFLHEGFEVRFRQNFAAGLKFCINSPPWAVILTFRPSGQSILGVFRDLRQLCPAMPVLVLDATRKPSSISFWLELGADDCITFPCDPRELLARVRAKTRHFPASPPALVVENVYVNFRSMRATKNGQEVHVTPQQFEILRTLVAHCACPVSRGFLRSTACEGHGTRTRSLDMQIRVLRRLLEPEPNNPRHLLTVRGVGYKFVQRGEQRSS
jgi:DNA-binding response OmpR family regulator